VVVPCHDSVRLNRGELAYRLRRTRNMRMAGAVKSSEPFVPQLEKAADERVDSGIKHARVRVAFSLKFPDVHHLGKSGKSAGFLRGCGPRSLDTSVIRVGAG